MSIVTAAATRPSPPSFVASAAWPALAADPTTGVCVVSLSGTVLWGNHRIAQLFLGPAANSADCAGRTFRQMGFPDAWIDERLAMYERIRQSGKPALSRTIWLGRQLLTWHYPVASQDGGPIDHLLVVSRPSVIELEDLPRDDEEHLTLVSSVMRLGTLDALTPRELEVFVLLGQGMTMREVAELLHRSPKTIERHRETIGRKLSIMGRVELADLARRAGLTPADLKRMRV
jgi:DNA-binding CsgD family transcriptional regulator